MGNALVLILYPCFAFFTLCVFSLNQPVPFHDSGGATIGSTGKTAVLPTFNGHVSIAVRQGLVLLHLAWARNICSYPRLGLDSIVFQDQAKCKSLKIRESSESLQFLQSPRSLPVAEDV